MDSTEAKHDSLFQKVGILLVDWLLFFILSSLLSLMLYGLFQSGDEQQPSTSFAQMIKDEALMLLACLASMWVVLKAHKLPIGHCGWAVRPKQWLAGAATAVAVYLFAFVATWLAGEVQVTGIRFEFTPFALSLLAFLLVAVFEEVMVRGFILARMLDLGIHKYLALVLSSLIFSSLHLFNPNFDLLPFLNIVLAGMMLGATYIYTRNLSFPIALHWFWNWMQGVALGYPVSGNALDYSLLTVHYSDTVWLTGGNFGFEGSLFCSLMLVVVTALLIKYFKKA